MPHWLQLTYVDYSASTEWDEIGACCDREMNQAVKTCGGHLARGCSTQVRPRPLPRMDGPFGPHRDVTPGPILVGCDATWIDQPMATGWLFDCHMPQYVLG